MKVSGTLTFMASNTRFAGLWDEFLSEGQVTLTQEQVRDRSGSSPGSVRVAVAEAQRRHLLFSRQGVFTSSSRRSTGTRAPYRPIGSSTTSAVTSAGITTLATYLLPPVTALRTKRPR